MTSAAGVNEASSTGVEPIACPRCGYDQRGVVSAWREQCPLQGTCTECGLVFGWSYVLLIAKYERRWCVEFEPEWWRVPVACVTTFLRSWHPFDFWRRLHMSSKVRWRRLMFYVLPLFLALVSLYVLVQTMHASMAYLNMTTSLLSYPILLQNERAFVQTTLDSFTQVDPAFAEVVQRFRGEEMRELQRRLDEIDRALQETGSIRGTFGTLWLEYVFMPFAKSSSCYADYPGAATHPADPPFEVFNHLGSRPPVGGVWFAPQPEPILQSLHHLAVAWLGAVLLPASFVLLPVSRRRAKVQWRHIGRTTMYSFAVPLLITIVMLVSAALKSLYISDSWVQKQIWHLPIVLWVFLPMWWWAAISQYLCMRHALLIAVMMTLMIALMVSPILFYEMPLWLEGMFT